jgi:hypothetical protein
VIGKLPVSTGGVNVIVACPFPKTATTSVGASGTVAGVIVLLVEEEILVPNALVAVTVNVYAVPFERPVTVIGEDPPVALKPPTFDVTV